MRFAAVALNLLFACAVCEAVEPLPSLTVTDSLPVSPSSDDGLTIMPPSPISGEPDAFGQRPVAPYTSPIGEPPWSPSPYQNSAWRIELDLIPTTSHVSDQSFGGWKDNSSLALRLNLGYEGCDGFGTRLDFWGFDDDASTSSGPVELEASTFYWDFYKRFFVQDSEIVLGGGLVGAHLDYNVKQFRDKAEYRGGGTTVFGEVFYPFWQFARTDSGAVGRGPVSLLAGSWRDHGPTLFVDETDNDLMTILELAWGLELRHRFGALQDKYWFINIVPEFQRWESSTLPGELDPGFEGTNITFGL